MKIYQGLEVEEFLNKKIRLRKLSQIEKIILHCSATDNEKTTIEDIHKWHLKRHWGGCGYHFFIDSEGLVFTGRTLKMIGCHCKNHNMTSIGVCLNGLTNFNRKQAISLSLLLKNMSNFKVKENLPIYPHNYFNKMKTCPNFDVGLFLNSRIFKLTPEAEKACKKVNF